jgi:hypothetical protein
MRRMTQAEMEEALEKLNVQVSSIRQILPTLATKQDLEQYATKADLRDGIADAKRHTDILVESVRDDIRLDAEGVASIITKVDSLAARIDSRRRRRDS